MATGQSSRQTARPIRELIWPEATSPTQPLREEDEQRRYHRYSGRGMLGILVVGPRQVPFTCVDMGYGGIQLLVHEPAEVQPGQRVLVRIEQGASLFESQYSVRHVAQTPEGLLIHLSL
jgi:hypothetical protein